jgi:uncharacterized membrane protein YdbT with pleckstrin-like domain
VNALFDTFTQLDPLLQVLAVVALIAFILITAFQLWRYLQKRRMRKREKIWLPF